MLTFPAEMGVFGFACQRSVSFDLYFFIPDFRGFMVKKVLWAMVPIGVLFFQGCQTKEPMDMKNVTLLSFTGEAPKGPSLGPVRGQSCEKKGLTAFLGGGDPPSLDKALINLRQGTRDKSGLDIVSGGKKAGNTVDVSYVNNVSVNRTIIDRGILGGGKSMCFVAKGLGYR